MKTYLIWIIVIIILAIALWWYFGTRTPETSILQPEGATSTIPESGTGTTQQEEPHATASGANPSNAEYVIEGKAVALENGRSERPAAPGSAAKIITSVFGNPVYGDLDGDGDRDAAVILTQTSGGSGTFYYIAASINTNGKHRGTNALLLGDRITYQRMSISSGSIFLDYLTRAEGESMSAAPSVAVSATFKLVGGRLEEVIK